MQTEQPRHHPVWSPGFSRSSLGGASVPASHACSPGFSRPERPSKRNLFFSPADSKSADPFKFFPEPGIGRAEKYRIFRITASIHRQLLTGFNKPGSFNHRGKSRSIAVNRGKKISFALSATQILQLRKDFPLRGYSVLPLPRGEGEGTLRTQTECPAANSVASSPSSRSAYLAYSAVCLFVSFVAFVGFCKMFWLRLRRARLCGA